MDPKTAGKILMRGKDRFCTFSAVSDGCKMKAGATYATTHFIPHKATITCGFELTPSIIDKNSYAYESLSSGFAITASIAPRTGSKFLKSTFW